MVSPVEKVSAEIALEINGINVKYLNHYPVNFEQLPTTWIPIYVGEILINIRPGFASGQHNQIGEGIPHIRPMNINRKGEIDLSQIKFVDPDTNDLRLNPGDIIFNNTNSPDLIGKTSAIRDRKDWGYSNHMTRLTPHKEVSYRYIAYQLHFLWMTGYYRNRCVHHVNQASISSQVFAKTIPIILAPLAEQYRIVEKIEELFSDLDKGIESLKTTQQQLKIYRQAVLKWAFEGKLTAKWREEKKHRGELKSAEELLEQIKAEREKRDRTQLQEWHEAVKTWEANGKQGKKPGKPQKVKDLSALIKADTDSLPELPNGWAWVHYSDICSQTRNGISAKPNSEIGEKIFRISAVRPFHIDLTDFRCIDNTSGQYNSFLLENGDILFTRYNGSRRYVGVCAKFDSDKRFLYPDKLIKTKLISSEVLCADYIMFASNIGSSRAFIDSRIRTTAGQSGISGDDIKSMPIPICSTEEQYQIVQEIEFRLSICDRLEATITENLQRAEALRQSILKQAFEGKLVPQDPNDEPAEKLIERIRYEKLHGNDGKLDIFDP